MYFHGNLLSLVHRRPGCRLARVVNVFSEVYEMEHAA
jgi:hypothetical protein